VRNCAVLWILLAPVLAARQPFATDDLWQWRSAADPQIRPDGQTVVYSEAWNDRTRGTSLANLWLVEAGSPPRQWTDGAWRDTSPRWSPDGERIAWLSNRTGLPQVYIRRVGDRDDSAVTAAANPPLRFAWSPDGKFIAYTARVPFETPPPTWAPAAILPLIVRPAAGYVQVFVVPATGGAAPRRVTQGNFDCLGEPAWLPDGRSIVIAREGDLAAVQVSNGNLRVLTKGPGHYSSPQPSPDGARIAWLFADAKPQSYTVRRLFVMNADGTRIRGLAGTLDRDATDPLWSSDSRTLYFLAEDHGVTHVYAARNDGSARLVRRPPERLRGFSLADNGRAVSIRSNAAEAGVVVTFPVDVESSGSTLASPNRRLLDDREIGAAEEIGYTSAGLPIQGWIVKPPQFDAVRKYPLLVDIQDSPRSMCGVEFRLRAQILAAKGFVVLCANPRGTPGYGEQFGHLLRTRYPGDDFDDLMRGVDFLAAKDYIDSRRLAVAGGLVAAWAIGHTDRFYAAVARRPIVDWAIHVATVPDGTRRATEWMGAMPWDDPEQYVKHSPLFFAQNFKTPALVLAAAPDPESDALYFALQQRKVESSLVRLPGSGPGDQVLELEATLAWLAKQ
jgi:acylaminoacyl-peptidase